MAQNKVVFGVGGSLQETSLDESLETLRQGYCIFLHDPGSIVVSKNTLINKQLQESEDWEHIYPFSHFHIFASKNIAHEIHNELPLAVRKFLQGCNLQI